MLNTVNTRGLIVEEFTPSPSSTVDELKFINIRFNSDLANLNSVAQNVFVYQDKNMIYSEQGENNLNDSDNYIPIKCTMSYKDRILTLGIKTHVPNSRYIVKINGNVISDTLSNVLNEYVYSFFTSSAEELPKCEIVTPNNGALIEYLGNVEFKYYEGETCLIQLSKRKDYRTLSYEVSYDIPSNLNQFTVAPNVYLEKGSYYMRVRTPNTSWSSSVQLIVDKMGIGNASVTNEDVSDVVDILNEIDNTDNEIIGIYPVAKDNVSLKQNYFGIKVTGKVNVDDIDLNNTYIIENCFDDTDNAGDSDEEELSKEINDITVSTYYSEDEDATYIIANINEKEEILDISSHDVSTDTQEDLKEIEKMEEIAREENGEPNWKSEGTSTENSKTEDVGTGTNDVTTSDEGVNTEVVTTTSTSTQI